MKKLRKILKKYKKFIFAILVVITVVNFIFRVYQYRSDIFRKFDYSYWTYRYMHSQWSPAKCLVDNAHINPYTCTWDDNWYAKHPTIPPQFQKISIGDDGLYIYAGAAYVKGEDPSLLNAELPPFGKYLVGLFEIYTGYIGIFSLVFSFLFLISFFLLSKKIFRSSLIALSSVAIFSFEPLFYSQIRAPFLDTAYATFLFFGFLLLLNKKYVISGILLGFFMAIKSPFLIFLVYSTVVIWQLIKKDFEFKKLIKMIISTGVIYVLCYFSIFFHGHGIIYFLKVQKYILNFYSGGAKAVIGAVFPMIISGKWYTWFSPAQTVAEWNILWPVALLGSIYSIYVWFRSKLPYILFLIIWLLIYFMFLSFTPIFSRYLLLALPFMYNLSIWVFYDAIKSRFSLG